MPKRVVGLKKTRRTVRVAGDQVNYHGGPLLSNAEITTIYWGNAWASDPLRTNLDEFFDFILGSTLIDQLSEYSVPGFTIGHGKHVQSVLLGEDLPTSIDDSQIQQRLDMLVSAGTVPVPNSNSVYAFFLPSGVTVTDQGESSCQNFCGYHNLSSSGLVYIVDPYDDCQGCQFVPGDLVGASTVVASHELCESITDPHLDGWFSDISGMEIGDFCEGQNKVINESGTVAGAAAATTFNVEVAPPQVTIDGTAPVNITVTLSPVGAPTPPPPPPPPPGGGQNWTVQTEWSNQQGTCV